MNFEIHVAHKLLLTLVSTKKKKNTSKPIYLLLKKTKQKITMNETRSLTEIAVAQSSVQCVTIYEKIS